MTRDFVKNTYKQGGNMWIWTNEHRPSARKTPAPGRSAYRKSLVEFAARTPRINSNPFFPRTCAGEKTLLSLQVCPQDARGRLQAPLSEKANGLFRQNRRPGTGKTRRRGGMPDGSIVQNIDTDHVASKRRTPVLADVFGRMQLMERRGSGLRKIKAEYRQAAHDREELEPASCGPRDTRLPPRIEYPSRTGGRKETHPWRKTKPG
jgi:hypothetical protein